MGTTKRRLTLGRLMAVIGIVALGLAIPRVEATPAVSLCVFAGCSWFLAGRRYGEALARRAAEEIPTGPVQRARLGVRCAFGAALAIGLPDAAFLGGYYGYMTGVSLIGGADHIRPDLEPEHILAGALIGIAAALQIAAIMRHGLRSAPRKQVAAPTDRRAVGLVGLRPGLVPEGPNLMRGGG